MDSITIQKGFKPGDRVVTDGQAYQSAAHKSELESQERGAVMLLAKVDRAVGKVAKHGEIIQPLTMRQHPHHLAIAPALRMVSESLVLTSIC